MTVALSPTPRQLFLNPTTGAPASGYLLFTYSAGTTIKQATYTDSTGLTANTNPVVMDSLGECDLWLTEAQAYKFVFSPPTDTDPPTNAIWTRDNIIVNNTQMMTFRFDGGGLPPSTGILGDMYTAVPFTVIGWALQADQTGSMVIDIWSNAFVVNTPPTVANSICGGNYPTLTAQQQTGVFAPNPLTGWTTGIPGSSAFRFNLRSIATITRFTLTLMLARTQS